MTAGAGGRIVLVGTPIGHLGDLSPRASATLRDADVIFCEDTRHSRKLLTAAGIRGPRLIAMHQHNEAAAAAQAVALAGSGATVAVISDAGMPGLSDPGARVVAAAGEVGVPVEVVPGPDAVVTALVLSGLPSDRFCFEGFLPRKGGERAARLGAIAAETRTTVIYESPRRVASTLNDLAAACGPARPATAARELTKVHEEVRRATLGELAEWAAEGEPRGEWVLVIGGAPEAVVTDGQIVAYLGARLAAGDGRRDAVDAVAGALGVGRRRVYQLALAENGSPESSRSHPWVSGD